MKNYKVNIIRIYQILKEYSDENNILTVRDINSKLKVLYGLSLDRKTIYGIIETLQSAGIDISNYKNNSIGYYLISRTLEPCEVKLLMDLIYTSRAISGAQTNEIIDKLQSLLSVNERKKYKYLYSVKNNTKTSNEQVFLNIDILEEAIEGKKKVKFTYLKYNFNKEYEPRGDEKYIVNPFHMISNSGKYYLILRKCNEEKIKFFRIDLMRDVEILNENLDASITKEELRNAKTKTKSAWYGEPVVIKIQCNNKILGNVIDDFGKEVHIRKKDKDKFIATVKEAPKGVVFWALKFLKDAEIISPPSVRQDIIECLENNSYVSQKIKS